MQIHRCLFVFSLQQVRFTSTTDSSPLQAVWHPQKGEPLMRGATKPRPKRSVATFNENFEIGTQLYRNQQTESYLPSVVLLEIRKANSPLEQPISSSICRFDLSQIINEGQFLEKTFKAQDGKFEAVISGSCNQIVNTGKTRKKSSSKKMKSSQSGLSRQNSIQRSNEKSKLVSKRGGSQKMQRQRSTTEIKRQKQVKQLIRQYQKQQAEHILTQQRLKQAENNLTDFQNIINQMSAQMTQKQTQLVQNNQLLYQTQEELLKLKEDNQMLKQSQVNAQKDDDHIIHVLRSKVNQLQHSLKTLNQNYNLRVKAETELQMYSQKLEQQNHSLQKQLQGVRKQLLKSSWQRDQLKSKISTIQQQKQEIKGTISRWKTQFLQQNQRNKSEMVNSEEQYQKIFQIYQQYKQKVKNIESYVPRHQIVQIQESYQEKIKVYQHKQIELKKQVDLIQEQMAELQILLEQSQARQLLLIDHSKQLQRELDSANAQSGWWNAIIDKQLKLGVVSQGSFKSINGDTRKDEVNSVQQKYKTLLKLLSQNSKSILSLQKHKKMIERLEQKEQQLTHKAQISNDELKEVKQRLIVIIKENKKLLQKNNKLNRDYQGLSKNYRKVQDQLRKSQQKNKLIQDDNDVVSYRLNIYQKQVKELKILLQAHKEVKEQPPSLIQGMATKTVSTFTPMPIIREESGELLASVQIRNVNKQTLNHKQNLSALRQLSDLLERRGIMVEQLLNHCTSKQNEQEQSLRSELKNVQKTTNKLKMSIIRSGQKAIMQQWLTSIRNLEKKIQTKS